MDPVEDFIKREPEAAGQLLYDWMKEDNCLKVLVLSTVFVESRDPNMRDALRRMVEFHERECGKCIWNVRSGIARAEDPYRKALYREAFNAFMDAWMKVYGWKKSLERRPEGTYHRATFPMDEGQPVDLPYTAVEMFFPSRSDEKRRITYDVKNAAIFDDPRPLFQHLDQMATGEAKAFPPELGSLHWRTIVGERPEILQVRWEGVVKKIAEDWTLQGRYSDLVRKHLKKHPFSEVSEEKRVPGATSMGEEALLLESLAIRYDGRSWFMGFLQRAAANRMVDAYRATLRRISHSAGPFEEEDSLGPEKRATLPISGPGRHEGCRSEEDDWIEQIEPLDLSLLVEDLRKRLPANQKAILDFKIEGLTDSEVATRMGLARETVNRHFAQIRNLAVRLKSKTSLT